MATEVVKTVKPSGGDYGSLSAWEAGQQGNIVVSDTIQTANLYAMQDTTFCDIDGWTTDATRYVNVVAIDRHVGIRSTSAYRLEVAGHGTALWINTAFTRVHGLQAKNTGGRAIETAAASIRISDTLTYDCSTHGFLLAGASGSVDLNNCIAMHNTGDGFSRSNGIHVPFNCVSVNNGGLGFNGAGLDGVNCYSGGNTGADYSGGSYTTCYSEDGTASTSTAAWSTSSGGFFANVTAGTEDVTIGSSSTLKDVGTAGNSHWVHPNGNVDVIGTARPQGAAWDVGAFEYVAGGVVAPAFYVPVQLASKYVGPAVLRFAFRQPYQAQRDEAGEALLQGSPAAPLKIPNKMVGPMALRQLFRQPRTPTSGLNTFQLVLSATPVVVTASLIKQVNTTLTATTVAVTASLTKQVNKILTATAVVVTASLIKSVGKSLTATAVVVTALLAKAAGKVLSATAVVVTASLVKSVGKALSATSVLVTASLARQIGKSLSATSSVTATVTKTVAKTLSATPVVVTATLSAVQQFAAGVAARLRTLLGMGT